MFHHLSLDLRTMSAELHIFLIFVANYDRKQYKWRLLAGLGLGLGFVIMFRAFGWADAVVCTLRNHNSIKMLVTSLRCRTPRLLFRPQLAKASSCFLCKRKTRPQMFEPPAGPTRPMCSAAPPPPAATSAAAATSVSVVVSQPPMAVRAALVGTSIGFGRCLRCAQSTVRTRHMYRVLP